MGTFRADVNRDAITNLELVLKPSSAGFNENGRCRILDGSVYGLRSFLPLDCANRRGHVVIKLPNGIADFYQDANLIHVWHVI